MSLCLVLPTRNRPELAMTAIRAMLAHTGSPLAIVVSDNSSSEEDARSLGEFCETTGDARLLYLRASGSTIMAPHWDWALQQAMARTRATHFGVHYDRKVAKTGGIEQLAAACTRYPDLVTTYACDFTYPIGDGFAAWQFPGSGKDFEIRTRRVIELSARGTFEAMGQAVPFLSNCLVPRPVLERIRTRFGTICDSATPDSSFAYRFCALEERYVHLDAALSVMYAFGHSNGLGYYRRDSTGTFGDFMQLWGDRPWLEAAPIPGLTLGMNMAFHEYNLVQREVGQRLFPPIAMDGYLREIARGLRHLADPRERADASAVLERHGWRPDPPPPPQRPLWRRALERLRPRPAPVTAVPDPHFATEAEAVGYLLSHSRACAERNALLDILEPLEVPR